MSSPRYSQNLVGVLLHVEALTVRVLCMLRKSSKKKILSLFKPNQVPVRPRWPLVQPNNGVQDTCMQHEL